MGENLLLQSASSILMIRPAGFGFNEETAETNVFQNRIEGVSRDELQERAVSEFDALVDEVRRAGVRVIVVEDQPEPPTPDAVFPNNWISFHEDGTVILYPMYAPSRRLERRSEVLEILKTDHGFRVTHVVDLTHHERQERFLEGTGSIVFDHVNRRAYANLSARTHPEILHEVTRMLGYDRVLFHASNEEGNAVYHTNVVMSIGRGFVVIAADAIRDMAERDTVLQNLETTGRRMVLIDCEQMERFAGNVLEVESGKGDNVLLMSAAAYDVFRPDQIETLEECARIVTSPIATFETAGGGSVRCMIAEVRLPQTSPERKRPEP